MTDQAVINELKWADIWLSGQFQRVMEAMLELKQKYPGDYEIRLNTAGDGALVFNNYLRQRYTAVDFEDGDDVNACLESLRQKVAALFA